MKRMPFQRKDFSNGGNIEAVTFCLAMDSFAIKQPAADAVSDVARRLLRVFGLDRRRPHARSQTTWFVASHGCAGNNDPTLGTSQAPKRDDIRNIGGFSDAVFNVVSSFLENDASRLVREVESVELYAERRADNRNACSGAVHRGRFYSVIPPRCGPSLPSNSTPPPTTVKISTRFSTKTSLLLDRIFHNQTARSYEITQAESLPDCDVGAQLSEIWSLRN